MLNSISKFAHNWFEPMPDSLKGYLSKNEITRILESSLLAGLIAAATTLLPNVSHLGLNPAISSLVVFSLTCLLRSLARLQQGALVVKTPDFLSKTVGILPVAIIPITSEKNLMITP